MDEDFSCSWDVLYGGLGISELQFKKKNIEKIFCCKMFSIFGHQIPGSALTKYAGSWSALKPMRIHNTGLNSCFRLFQYWRSGDYWGSKKGTSLRAEIFLRLPVLRGTPNTRISQNLRAYIFLSSQIGHFMLRFRKTSVADPDPLCHFDADPDPNEGFKPWKSAQIGSYSFHFILSSANWCGSGSDSGSSLSLWCGFRTYL